MKWFLILTIQFAVVIEAMAFRCEAHWTSISVELNSSYREPTLPTRIEQSLFQNELQNRLIETTPAYFHEVLGQLISTIDDLSSQGARPQLSLDLNIRATRNDFLKSLYDNDMVLAGRLTHYLSDKLVMAKLLEHYMGENYLRFHPKTEGLITFLFEKKILDPRTGKVKKTRSEIASIFHREFPEGFIIKPSTGWSSKGRSFFKDEEEVFDLLVAGEKDLYSHEDLFIPFYSEALGIVASGEEFIIQERLGLTEGLVGPNDNDSKQNVLKEYRVHSFWGHFVPGAIKGRWIGANPSETEKNQVLGFIQDFMDGLPKGLRQRQAWSYDILELEPGSYSIIEVNTNRGKKGHWSGSLHNPRIIAAHIQFMERHYSWKFKSLSGFLLRYGLSNRARWKKHNAYTRESHNVQQ